MMDKELDRGQVNASAAEVYEEFFLPALFRPWVGPVISVADVQPGHRVLDVACGTGVLARAVSDTVGTTGAVVGLDPNAGMLAVAGRMAPGVTWVRGSAEALPFEDASFDSVVSQFGLMFFDDGAAGIREMLRVLRPGGNLAIAVWDSLDHTPGYAAVTLLLGRLFGADVANALRAPFTLGDRTKLHALFEEAGAAGVEITTHEGVAHFPSIASWMHTDIRGWTLADAIDDEKYEALLEQAQVALHSFVAEDGTVVFPAPAHIAVVRNKP